MVKDRVSSSLDLSADEQVLWESIVAKTVETFRMDEEEVNSLRENKLLRMFGLLPYFAECPNYEGIGLLNVSIYITERRGGKDLFAHTEDNDPDYLSRLKPFRDIMTGGDEEIIERGLALAGLAMLRDYSCDQEQDAENGKYNPLNSGSWNYNTAWQSLEGRARTAKAGRLETVLAVSVIMRMWWWLK